MTLPQNASSALFVALLLLVACGDSQPVSESPDPTDSQEGTSRPALTPSVTIPEAVETPSSFKELGPDAVWDPLDNEDRLLRVQACSIPKRTECVIATMEDLNATPEAVGFFRLTGWFLSDFREMGPVDLGSILDPWRANSNGDFALLNGTPAVVILEDEGRKVESAIANDATYGTLVASFPDLLLWPNDNVFEMLDGSPQGGQRLLFQFYLVDGCHACVTGYMARVALDFASDGTYLSFGALSLCRADWARDETPAAESVPACPARGQAAPAEAIPDFPQSALPEIHEPTSRVAGDSAPTAPATSNYCLNRVGAPMIQGSDDFKQRTHEALAILPTENSSLVGCWLQAILEGPSSSGGSGVDVDTGVFHATGDHAFAYPDPQISTIFYASIIVHDAVHVRDYWQGRPFSGADGELSALQVQLEVLQTLGSPPWMIACTQEIVDNIHDPSYQFWNGADPPCTLAQEAS